MSDLASKSVLVTGADGFIGSHLTQILKGQGCNVRALVQYNSFNSWGWLDEIDLEDVEVVCGDVRDPDFCRSIVSGMDIVFNLAALIAIPYSYTAPGSYVDTNIKGTLGICQAARDSGCSRVVQTSTSEVYGTAQYVPIDEKHPLQPQSPYSASKIGSDMLAMSFYNAFDLPVSIARPFNTYGPRQSCRAIIPSIITQIADGKKQIMIGDVSPTRDFNFVEDTCEGMIAVAQSDKTIGEAVNIGSGVEVSIGDTLNMIKDIMDSDVEYVVDDQRLRPEKSEVFRLCCDNSKLKELTGFEHKHKLEAGLRLTIDWFKKPENLAHYKTGIYNV
ncbi:NAD-dependent dehydratase [bacterium E08(2017)]|nr:NAD-dependent dehydratase [bacterium E08(2017)]